MEKYTVSTRIRFARNIKGYPFTDRMSEPQKKELRDKVKNQFFGANSAMAKDYEYVDIDTADRIYAMSLCEKNLISSEFLSGKNGRGLILSKDGTLSVMINEEDHLRIQVIMPGSKADEALQKAKAVDKLLSALGYAYTDKLGYLTSCPTNLGTGMRASLMLHLPGITESGASRELFDQTDRIGMTLRGTSGEGSKVSGCLYQLSNRTTLGLTEDDIIKELTEVANQIAKQEEKLAVRLMKNKGIILEDKIMRACGTMKSARLISSEEMVSLYSLCRFGIETGLVEMDAEKLDKAYFACRPACMALECEKDNSSMQRDKKRAQKVNALFLKGAVNEA